ncbi:hemagglutinin/amebocyte aggregation factor [Elysia marginata]|uniref:Hemagglutinin/amebocyte aggregation factor n=1 Tax=Elysia marginata TaxID=1093978 RepID=A0AAV4HXS0_9GAST|nr:hemagglutinin/amebocyte aggregation factor [Elysia marginata]
MFAALVRSVSGFQCVRAASEEQNKELHCSRHTYLASLTSHFSPGLGMTLTTISVSEGWMTDWDQHFTFSCPDNQMLKTIESIHDNGKEDRVFNFGCSPLPGGAALTGCEWSGQ